MSDFFVEMKIKEKRRNFTPIVDIFRGTAEDARDLLDMKYCNYKSPLFDFRKFWEVGSKEIEVFAAELEKKFGKRQ